MTNPSARLRAIAEALPEGASATLSREFLLEVTAEQRTAEAGDLTVPQLAERFERSPSTIRSWLERGIIRGYRRRGREWRAAEAAVVEFEERERAGTPHDENKAQGVSDLSAWRRVG